MSMWEGERKGESPEWGLRGHAIERSDTYLYMKRHAFHQEAAGRSRISLLVLQVLCHSASPFFATTRQTTSIFLDTHCKQLQGNLSRKDFVPIRGSTGH